MVFKKLLLSVCAVATLSVAAADDALARDINSVAYDKKNVKSYIAQAGWYKQSARRRPFVIYMNGKVASTRTGFFSRRYPKVEPGCEIVVPQKMERNGRGLQNVMGMMTSTASLAAMVASVINLAK